MRNILKAFSVGILALSAGLTACESEPQHQVAEKPHFAPPVEVDSSQYYAEREAYYAQHPGQHVVHHVYHNALHYTRRQLYYADPLSAYHDPHSHAYQRDYDEERQYEAAHPDAGSESRVAPAAVAGAAGVAAGAAASYYAAKNWEKIRGGSQPSAANARLKLAAPVKGPDGKVAVTKTPKLLSAVKAPESPAPAGFSKTPSPVFTVPAKSKSAASAPSASSSESHHTTVAKASSSAKSRTFSFTKSRSGFFRRSGRR